MATAHSHHLKLKLFCLEAVLFTPFKKDYRKSVCHCTGINSLIKLSAKLTHDKLMNQNEGNRLFTEINSGSYCCSSICCTDAQFPLNLFFIKQNVKI